MTLRERLLNDLVKFIAFYIHAFISYATASRFFMVQEQLKQPAQIIINRQEMSSFWIVVLYEVTLRTDSLNADYNPTAVRVVMNAEKNRILKTVNAVLQVA